LFFNRFPLDIVETSSWRFFFPPGFLVLLPPPCFNYNLDALSRFPCHDGFGPGLSEIPNSCPLVLLSPTPAYRKPPPRFLLFAMFPDPYRAPFMAFSPPVPPFIFFPDPSFDIGVGTLKEPLPLFSASPRSPLFASFCLHGLLSRPPFLGAGSYHRWARSLPTRSPCFTPFLFPVYFLRPCPHFRVVNPGPYLERLVPLDFDAPSFSGRTFLV